MVIIFVSSGNHDIGKSQRTPMFIYTNDFGLVSLDFGSNHGGNNKFGLNKADSDLGSFGVGT
ncbi:hypothetical protein Lalb_Chr24g0399191 [Lupinus albus]|uniref:Uncharacterized protein n=1 Tax=Lupinus albus TaxID=3870 RepID=A0A6A4MRA8_LUPAL|nr:hypothetical protein Lalb_Chr24g0399191 [Lupinus albus]